jgi:hypothetical protein
MKTLKLIKIFLIILIILFITKLNANEKCTFQPKNKELIIIPNNINIINNNFNIIKIKNNQNKKIKLIFQNNNIVSAYRFIPNEITLKPHENKSIMLKRNHIFKKEEICNYHIKIVYENKIGYLKLNSFLQ